MAQSAKETAGLAGAKCLLEWKRGYSSVYVYNMIPGMTALRPLVVISNLWSYVKFC